MAFHFIPLFIFVLVALELQATENFVCPDQTFKTDFISPVTHLRRVFCSKRLNDGSLVQHGPEWIFDLEQKVTEIKKFHEGEILQTINPAEQITEPPGPELPKDYGFMRTAIQEFLYLILPVNAPSRGTVFYGGFATDRCYTSPIRQQDFFIKQSDSTLPLRPRFARGCSLQGQATILANQATRVNLEARLTHYEAIDMMIAVHLARKDAQLTEVKISITSGRLTHPKGHLEFEGEYSLLLTDNLEVREPHEGTVTILREASKPVQQRLSLKLLMAPTKL
jgi:hypothetical protein